MDTPQQVRDCSTCKSTRISDGACLDCSGFSKWTPDDAPSLRQLASEIVASVTPAVAPTAPPPVPLETKPTNPKDAIGSTKLPLNLVPDSLVAYAAVSFAEGASKYGSYNWRVAGVRASIYKAALERHLKKWWNGEWEDQKTKVPHLASVIACAGILLDAEMVGKLTDDRPPKVPMAELMEHLEGIVKHVYEMHKDMHPHHHTALDSDQ